ncbi:MAG: hypothetical protein D3923_05350 [Candidatus Electrothrix sp. AR3]|nr:hypothetical protein [Candidatus Electrothrix sp. AR3]
MLSAAESAWCTVPVFKNGRKISRELQYILWEHASQHPECTSSAILQNIKAEYENFNITTRHVNRLRQKWGLNRKKGRPSGGRLLNAPGGEFQTDTKPSFCWGVYSGRFCGAERNN